MEQWRQDPGEGQAGRPYEQSRLTKSGEQGIQNEYIVSERKLGYPAEKGSSKK